MPCLISAPASSLGAVQILVKSGISIVAYGREASSRLPPDVHMGARVAFLARKRTGLEPEATEKSFPVVVFTVHGVGRHRMAYWSSWTHHLILNTGARAVVAFKWDGTTRNALMVLLGFLGGQLASYATWRCRVVSEFRRVVDEIGSDCVVVAHSMGALIAAEAVRDVRPRVRLLMTLGLQFVPVYRCRGSANMAPGGTPRPGEGADRDPRGSDRSDR